MLWCCKAITPTIKNLECYGIKVSDRNGACVRLSGSNLVLDSVHFHDSQQGLLTGPKPGQVHIIDSKFERLGHSGRAHAIYVGGGYLLIENSRFLSSKDEGHEIKSRARETRILGSVVASLEGRDSRLVDVSNGGLLIVRDSILQQGNNTSNWNLIGYGFEGYKHDYNRIELSGNIFLLDRVNGNKVLSIKNKSVKTDIAGNVFIGKTSENFKVGNFLFENRADARMEPAPYLPPLAQ